MKIRRLLYVEDTYGKDFHAALLRKLLQSSTLDDYLVGRMPEIMRMPAKKCNHMLYRKVAARIVDYYGWRMLFVIDSEGRPDDVAERDVVDHFPEKFLDTIKVVIVRPKHEAWLCIGLGGEPSRCRSDPIRTLERILSRSKRSGRPYSKDQLAKYADKIDVQKLLGEDDFKKYIDGLKWLMS